MSYTLHLRWPDETWVTTDVNMTNARTALVLSALGLSMDDPSLIYLIDDLKSACERYLNSEIAEFVDRGKPGSVEGNWIEGSVRDGYITERVQQMLNIVLTSDATEVYFA